MEFNAPPDTIEVISEAVFTANHLTDTDKQNSTGKYKQIQYSHKLRNHTLGIRVWATFLQLRQMISEKSGYLQT